MGFAIFRLCPPATLTVTDIKSCAVEQHDWKRTEKREIEIQNIFVILQSLFLKLMR